MLQAGCQFVVSSCLAWMGMSLELTPKPYDVQADDDICWRAVWLCFAPAGSTPCGPAGTRRHQLVVVASLIDKVPNLAGLARTAEVLGAGTLVLSDLRVANDSLFTRWVGAQQLIGLLGCSPLGHSCCPSHFFNRAPCLQRKTDKIPRSSHRQWSGHWVIVCLFLRHDAVCVWLLCCSCVLQHQCDC